MNSLFETTAAKLAAQNLTVVSSDFSRPWGGFFVIDENQAQEFANLYFDGLDVSGLRVAWSVSHVSMTTINWRITPMRQLGHVRIYEYISGS